MKRVIILAGVSGVGKTRKRTTDEQLKDLPVVDVADIRRQAPLLDWRETFYALVTRLEKLLDEHDTVVVEGYFVPGSATRTMLEHELRGVDHVFIDLHASLHTCRTRVASSGVDVEGRLEVLERVWPQAEAQYRKLNGKGIHYVYSA